MRDAFRLKTVEELVTRLCRERKPVLMSAGFLDADGRDCNTAGACRSDGDGLRTKRSLGADLAHPRRIVGHFFYSASTRNRSPHPARSHRTHASELPSP